MKTNWVYFHSYYGSSILKSTGLKLMEKWDEILFFTKWLKSVGCERLITNLNVFGETTQIETKRH